MNRKVDVAAFNFFYLLYFCLLVLEGVNRKSLKVDQWKKKYNSNICIKKNIRIRWNLVSDTLIEIWYFFSSLSSSWCRYPSFLNYLIIEKKKIFENCSRWYLKILEELLRKSSFGITFGGKQPCPNWFYLCLYYYILTTEICLQLLLFYLIVQLHWFTVKNREISQINMSIEYKIYFI